MTDVERNPEADLAELRAEPLDYSHDHTCRCPMCNGEEPETGYKSIEEQAEAEYWGLELAVDKASMEAESMFLASMSTEEYNAVLDEWTEESAGRYDARGGW